MAVKPGKIKGTMVLDIVKFAFDIMQTVAFMMFIQEEALQIRGFGVITLIREGLVDEVKTQKVGFLEAATNLETFCNSWGKMAPYVRSTYLNYAKASFDQADSWQAWIDAKEAETEKYGIRIVSSPTNAEIYIDGKKTEFLTPHTFYELPKKTTLFKLRYESPRRGIGTYEKAELIESDKLKEVRWILTGFDIPEEAAEPLPKTGIRIVSSPSAAEIFIDDNPTDKLTPQTFRAPPLSIGKHTFKLRYVSSTKGLMTFEEDITLEEDKLKEFRWVLLES